MKLQFSILALSTGALFSGALCAQQNDLPEIIVTATRIELADTEAPYASEIHTRTDIERTGAVTLTDYLSRYSSVQILANYGNRFSPAINMRGYGYTDGYQNVVVSVNGRRLNNIDMVPQLLNSVSLADIDRIEITKGSGSVLYGDGAMAGSIQIYTKPRTGAQIEAYAGNKGIWGATANAGLMRENFAVSASMDRYRQDGFGHKDASGKKDDADQRNWSVNVSGKPVSDLKLEFDASRSETDVRYPGPITLDEFRHNPSGLAGTLGPNLYTRQKMDTTVWGLGAEYSFTPAWKLSVRHNREDKESKFPAWNSKSDYDYRSNDIALQYMGSDFSVTAGVQTFDGTRKGSDNKTMKDNIGWFVHGQYFLGDLTLSAGARTEKIEYEYKPTTGNRLKDDVRLSAWELGANYRFSETFSVFGNYSRGFQAPDIDRFFTMDWGTGVTSFNGFIEPAKAHTFNLGLNHVTSGNRLKLTAFYARLKNEIYYFQNPAGFDTYNTNLDKSHKYGIELQDHWKINERLTASLNYSWTRAKIDREDSGSGAYNGKELPGVPEHAAIIGLSATPWPDGELSLFYTWRGKAWAADDFDNNNAQKQRPYESVDISYRHRVHKQVELFASVQNLFEHKNGLWVADDAIYPVDFTRLWKIGARVSF